MAEPLAFLTPGDPWAHYQGRGSAPQLELFSELVDCPAVAGTCESRAVVRLYFAKRVSDESTMLGDAPSGLEHFSIFYVGQRSEFVALLVRQFRCGKVCLRKRMRGGGTVFPVPKSHGASQREVWQGQPVSEAARPPPAPRFLTSAARFRPIVFGKDELLRVRKRDGICFFEQLVLPESLQQWMAWPPVTMGELIGAGMSASELLAHCVDFVPCSFVGEPGLDPHPHSERVWPCGCVCGMVFSWSSCVV